MSDTETPARPVPTDSVGYGKPPKNAQFKKGVSGNPKGRPKKVRPAPIRHEDEHSRLSFERTAYGPITLRQDGKVVKRTRREALDQAMFAQAFKGNRLQSQYLDKKLAAAEEKAAAAASENYTFWRDYKWKAEADLKRCEEERLTPKAYIPHPADIVLDPFKMKVHFLGPLTKDSLPAYEAMMLLRDFFLGYAMLLEKRLNGPRALPDKYCPYQMLSVLYNQQLPPSMRHDISAGVSAVMAWDITIPEIRKRLKLINGQLSAIPPIDADVYVETYWKEKEQAKNASDHLERMIDITEELVHSGKLKDKSLDESSAMVLEALKLRQRVKI